jgi:hypothetical protein
VVAKQAGLGTQQLHAFHTQYKNILEFKPPYLPISHSRRDRKSPLIKIYLVVLEVARQACATNLI